MKNSLIITAIYFVVGVLWIVISDFTLTFFVKNIHEFTLLQTYKGWFYVFVTSLLLFFLVFHSFRTMHQQYLDNIEEIKKHEKTKISLLRNKKVLKASRMELSKYDKLLHTIINSSPDAIFAKDLEGKYILFNKGAAQIAGVSAQEVLGQTDTIIFPKEIIQTLQEEDQSVIQNGKIIHQEETLTINKGAVKTFLITKGPLKDKYGQTFGIFGISRDITGQKKYENHLLESKEKFYKLSHIDTLTELPNRLFLSEKINEKTKEKKPFSLILLDLDEFKMMNDSYGHRFGDKILIQIAHILQDVFTTNTFIARMGGDEFGIIFESIEQEKIHEAMDTLYTRLNEPFEVDLINVYITASAGICRYPEDAATMEEIYQEADVAMYNAKKIGKNRFSFYDEAFKKETLFHTQIITKLKQALDTNELELYFQSQNDTSTHKIVGLEALLRWRSHEEMIPPDIFIPIAEHTTLIIEIGNFVLQRGFETIVKWRDLGLLKERVAINISARHLMHANFILILQALLEQTSCIASWVEIEITESSVLENPELTIKILEQLKALGFHISMDDFGTGYSSLSYLKSLPIDKLKIDRSFITNITHEPKNQIIVKTIIFLAKELGLHVLAEGVETQEELDFLVENKIDSIQGYYYTKPLPEVEMLKLLQS